ncbi:unnamed protein product [Microthlaspi erraticum]|uniref:Cystatin domain-containing protein n=1 Tax=Microthlaspi erraticum TaxID=1685480 RepID=A0A6D2I829_9BRAS|nr:unnamed protein product [Microthlaspi erraticum]
MGEPGAPDWTAADTLHVFMRLRCEPEDIPEDVLNPFGKGPYLSLEEELRLINKQVEDSEGFDINFKEFRDIYNYQPVDFDDKEYVMPPETHGELMDRLSRDSLEIYNERKGTRFELVKVFKANYHETGIPATMYFITFQGKDPSDDDEPKDFRAKVCHFSYSPNKYHSCELKPVKNVHFIETEEQEYAKKRRLAEELSNAGK